MSPQEDYCDKINLQYPASRAPSATAAAPSPSSGNASIHRFFFPICLIYLHRIDVLDVDSGTVIMATPATRYTRSCCTIWSTCRLQQNATMVFKAAMWRCMTPMKKKQLSAHDVSVGNWKPTKNHTLAKRLPGSGATMNMLYDDQIYSKGYIDDTNVFISNYQYNLDLMGVGRKHSSDNYDCPEQVAFNPSHKKPDDQQQQSYNITQFSNSRYTSPIEKKACYREDRTTYLLLTLLSTPDGQKRDVSDDYSLLLKKADRCW
uniref:chitinase n=1 Tax=Oryza meridionalis TaxID=40149 RepID=A0A0E0FAY8_9ORYZ